MSRESLSAVPSETCRLLVSTATGDLSVDETASEYTGALFEDKPAHDVEGIALSSSIFNLTKSAIGSSIIILPKALSLCGLVLGSLLIFISALVTYITLCLISRLSVCHVSDYITLGKKTFGRKGEIVMVIFQVLLLLAPMTAFVQFNGVLMRSLLIYFGCSGDAIYTSASFLSFASTYIFIYPLCCLRSLGTLSCASVLGLVSVLYISSLTMIDFAYDTLTSEFSYDVVLWKWDMGILSALNTFTLSFLSHTSLLPIISEMKRPTEARKVTLTTTTQAVVFLFYMMIAVFGYLHFGESIRDYDNLLVMKENFTYALAILLFVVMNIVSFPLAHYPARLSLDWFLTQVVHRVPVLASKWDCMKTFRLTFEAFTLVTTSVFLALSFDSVLDIFDVFVPISGSFLVFTLPALCFLKERDTVRASTREVYLCYFSLAVGCLLFFIGAPVALFNFFHC